MILGILIVQNNKRSHVIIYKQSFVKFISLIKLALIYYIRTNCVCKLSRERSETCVIAR